jgi:hypothetical protein
MRNSDVIARAYSNPGRRSIDIYLFDERVLPEHKTTFFVRQVDDGLNFCGIAPEVAEAGSDSAPAFYLSPEDAQLLMNSLWDCGLRPLQAAGSTGQLDAVKYHLEDMRRIVFDK